MKRAELEKHLRAHGCQLYREGGRHSVWWNRASGKTSVVPRHREINEYTARGICRSLEIPPLKTLNVRVPQENTILKTLNVRLLQGHRIYYWVVPPPHQLLSPVTGR